MKLIYSNEIPVRYNYANNRYTTSITFLPKMCKTQEMYFLISNISGLRSFLLSPFAFSFLTSIRRKIYYTFNSFHGTKTSTSYVTGIYDLRFLSLIFDVKKNNNSSLQETFLPWETRYIENADEKRGKIVIL